MRSALPRATIHSLFAVVTLLSLTALSAELQAQFRLSGSPPAGLSPRPATPLQGGITKPGSNQPAQNKPPLNMTLVDPGPIGAETTTSIYFPQVAVGGGYSTVFTLVNTGSTSVNGNLFLTGQDGNPLTVIANDPRVTPTELSPNDLINATGSSFPVIIPSGALKILTATALSSSDPTVSGWARVTSSGGSLGGVGTFQLTTSGVLTTIAGVLASQPVQFATTPLDDDDSQSRFTGYAVANPGIDNINVKVSIVDENGILKETLSPSVMNPLAPQKQVARFLFQDSSTYLKFKGSMVFVAQGGKTFVIVALVLNKGLFTAIPVIPEKAPIVPN